jgi:Uma2 family endonuclease
MHSLVEAYNHLNKCNWEVFTSPVDVFLGETVYRPDLVVVCDPSKLTFRGVEGPPDLVVEVVSNETAKEDIRDKLKAYEAAGVPEYLLVDPADSTFLLFRPEDGRYRPASIDSADWDKGQPILGGKIIIALD